MYYEVIYRLDDIEDYDNTEYSGEISNKRDSIKYANSIKKEYGDRVVMLDIHKYDDEGCLIDAVTLI